MVLHFTHVSFWILEFAEKMLVQVKGNDHAARLESFYGPQAHACKV